MKAFEFLETKTLAAMVCTVFMVASQIADASDTNAKKYLAQAQTEMRAGNVSRAELLYAQAMQESPNDIGASMSLAELYIVQHRFNDASKLIDKAMQTNSADYRVWKTRAQWQRSQGNESQAIADYEKAFSLGGKEDSYVLNNLQQHYEKTGNTVRKKQMDNDLQWVKMKGSR